MHVGETRDESNGEGSPSPCVRESRQHTVCNVGHNDGLRTDGVVDETTRPPIVVSGWIRSLLVGNDRMWTMGRDVAWSAFCELADSNKDLPWNPMDGNNSQAIPTGTARLCCFQERYLSFWPLSHTRDGFTQKATSTAFKSVIYRSGY